MAERWRRGLRTGLGWSMRALVGSPACLLPILVLHPTSPHGTADSQSVVSFPGIAGEPTGRHGGRALTPRWSRFDCCSVDVLMEPASERLSAEVELADAVRADPEADVGQVVEILARDEPDDVADLAVVVVLPERRERLRGDPLVSSARSRSTARRAQRR